MRMNAAANQNAVSSRAGARSSVVSVRAEAPPVSAAKLTKSPVPLKLEEGVMPLNTYSNKKPFVGRIKSVQRIVGPKATGETMEVVIETDGLIPFWEGQSYGVIPPGGWG